MLLPLLQLSIKPGAPHHHIAGHEEGTTNQTVVNSVNAGTGSLIYTGHGEWDRWGQWSYSGEDWKQTQIDVLQNGPMTPVVVQLGCFCSNITSAPGNCISESWIAKREGGAVAAMGAHEFEWVTPADHFATGFLLAIGDNTSPQSGGGHAYCDPRVNLGDIMMLMVAYVNLYSPGDGEVIHPWLLLGDPSMPVWTGGAPRRPLVTYQHAIPGTECDLPVSVTVDGTPVCSALVSLTELQPQPGEQFPRVLDCHRTDHDGNVTLRVPYPRGDISVTVTEGHVREDDVLQPGGTRTPILQFTSGTWCERARVPLAPSGKQVKAGGWLAYNAGNGLVYAAKGNKQQDFYAYYPDRDSWSGTGQLPALADVPLGTEGKPPAKGCVGCADGSGHIYMTKGNNKLGFYTYDATADLWTQKKDVPLGGGQKVKNGADIVWAYKGSVGSPYLLKGYKNEFYRYDTGGDTWLRLPDAPVGANWKWDKGSWLAYDDVNNKIYAFKAKYQEFYRYSPDGDSWSGLLARMPVPGSGGNKKAKDGSRGAYAGGCVYAFKGGNTQEFWLYNTATNVWAEKETLPGKASYSQLRKKVLTGADLVEAGSQLFALKGNKTLEFWRYTPGISTMPALLNAGGPSHGGVVASSGGTTLDGETPIMDGLSASLPRWDPAPWSSMVVYSREDTPGDDYEQVYQRFYGSSIPEQRVTEVETDCEEPVVSPPRPGGQLIAFQMADTVSDSYEICVTPAYAAGGGGGSGGTDEVSEEPVGGTSDAVAPANAVVPVGSVSAHAATGGSTILSRPIWQRTFGDEADRLHPEFDQTGSWICYERDVDGAGGCYTQIWRVPADGGPEEQITFDNADHFSPNYLNPQEISLILSPNDGYDVVAKANVFTHQVTVLSNLMTDHDRPNPAWGGASVVAEALDDAGNSGIVKIPAWGGPEQWIAGAGANDLEAPDYSQDNRSVFAVRWTGITSQIVCVDAMNGGWWPVTDTLAIRDNPDAHLSPNSPISLAVYEREAWNPLDLLLGGGKRKPGSGIYLSKFRSRADRLCPIDRHRYDHIRSSRSSQHSP